MSFFKPENPVFISGVTHHFPSRAVSNDELIAWSGKKLRSSFISARTGIESRHWAADEEACSDLAVAAIEKLFAREKIAASSIRQLVLGTVSGDFSTPPTSPLVAHRLGLTNCGAFDLGAACAGFVSALHVAAGMTTAFGHSTLVVQSEVRSKYLSPENMNTTVLFGDGATATLVTKDEAQGRFRILGSEPQSDGSVADLISVPAGGSRNPALKTTDPLQFSITMKDGAAVFLKAVHGMVDAGEKLLRALELDWKNVAWVVPHQANQLLMREMGKNRPEIADRIFDCIRDMGNVSGASVGIALSRLAAQHALKRGEKILLISAGGGGLAATALLEVHRD